MVNKTKISGLERVAGLTPPLNRCWFLVLSGCESSLRTNLRFYKFKNTTDYQQKAAEFKNDTSTLKLSKGPTEEIQRAAKVNCYRSLDEDNITKAQYYLLCSLSESVPGLQGLPKIHEQTCTLRSIVSSILVVPLVLWLTIKLYVLSCFPCWFFVSTPEEINGICE